MNIKLSADAVVVMVGAIATGKSTLVSKHFSPHHIVESDYIREQLSGDSEDQTYNKATFEILFATVDARLKAGIFTVVDSTGNGQVLDTVGQLAKKHKRDLVVLRLPHLEPDQINKKRFGKRWFYRDVYHTQVARIDRTVFPNHAVVHMIDDINTVDISVQDVFDENSLNPDYRYVIVPDLHGEYRVLEEAINRYSGDPDMKFVFLGDIVDRGESSYKTFKLVKMLINSGKAHVVISNHCNKAYRWFMKWSCDDSGDKFTKTGFSSYGMKIAHGLSNTLFEFQQMNSYDMKKYAEDFISYYENANPYLRLERPEEVHYFSHAGINRDLLKGMPVTKKDLAVLLYQTLKEEDVGEFNHLSIGDNVVIHLGHDSFSEAPLTVFQDDTTKIIKHDQGIGKIVLDIDNIDNIVSRFVIV